MAFTRTHARTHVKSKDFFMTFLHLFLQQWN